MPKADILKRTGFGKTSGLVQANGRDVFDAAYDGDHLPEGRFD